MSEAVLIGAYTVRLDLHASPDDPEKLVTPGIILVNAQHPKLAKHGCKGLCLFVGWWHWGASICIGRAATATQEDTQRPEEANNE